MKLLRTHLLFFTCCLLFTGHQLLQKGLQISVPFFDAYLDCLTTMPIVFTLLMLERKWIFKKKPVHFTVFEILITTIYMLLISEVVLPYLSASFTADWADVFCLSIGSAAYWFTTSKLFKKPMPLLTDTAAA